MNRKRKIPVTSTKTGKPREHIKKYVNPELSKSLKGVLTEVHLREIAANDEKVNSSNTYRKMLFTLNRQYVEYRIIKVNMKLKEVYEEKKKETQRSRKRREKPNSVEAERQEKTEKQRGEEANKQRGKEAKRQKSEDAEQQESRKQQKNGEAERQ